MTDIFLNCDIVYFACLTQNESDGLPFPNTESEFSITDAVGADLIDKPFPRSSLADESKSGSESVKRKDATKEMTGTTTAESLSHKDAVDSMICIALIISSHRCLF